MKGLTQTVVDLMQDSTTMELSVLFTFYLSGQTLRYAASKTNITFDGDVYYARTISHEGYNLSATGQVGRISITVDDVDRVLAGWDVAPGFTGRPVMVKKVWRDALGVATSFEEVFYGVMLAPSFPPVEGGRVMTIDATAGSSLRHRWPDLIYQRMCPLTFGGVACANSITGAVDAAGANPKYEFYSTDLEDLAPTTGTVDGNAGLKDWFDDSTRIGQGEDAWTDRTLTWLDGANKGEYQAIDSFATQTGKFGFAGNFTVNISLAETYAIGELYAGYMLQWTSGNNAGEYAIIEHFYPQSGGANGAFVTFAVGDAFTNNIQATDEFIISNADIARPPLRVTGTLSATSTSDDEAIDTVDRAEDDDYWKLGTLTITHGADTESRIVLGWDNASKTWTLTRAYSFTPTIADTYVMVAGCDKTWGCCAGRHIDDLLCGNGGFELGDLRAWAYEDDKLYRLGPVGILTGPVDYVRSSRYTEDHDFVDDEFNTRWFEFVEGLNRHESGKSVQDFEAGVSSYGTFTFAGGWAYDMWRYDRFTIGFQNGDNAKTSRHATYTVQGVTKQTGASALEISSVDPEYEIKLFQAFRPPQSGGETQDMYEASASVYIDNAAAITGLTLAVEAIYETRRNRDDADWEIVGEEDFDVGSKGSWQTVEISGAESDPSRQMHGVRFIIRATALDGKIYIDDCAFSPTWTAHGPVADNREQFKGFLHVQRVGDALLQ